MTEKKAVSKSLFSADWFLRGALTRIGDTFDRLTGRKWIPSSSLATSELIERMKRLLDSEAKEVPGKGRVVPHNIKLKMQWDKFSTDSETALTILENELLTAAADHINDSLYYTYAPLNVSVKPDYFTEGVKLYVGFDEFSDEEPEVEMNVTISGVQFGGHTETPKSDPAAAVAPAFNVRYTQKGYPREMRLEFPPGRRVSIGRTANNDLILDDVSISKLHASLVADAEGNLSVADTGSTNGTFINDERISYGKASRLEDNDRVKFGNMDVTFERLTQRPIEKPPELREGRVGRETGAIDGFDFTTRRAETPIPKTQEKGTAVSDKPAAFTATNMNSDELSSAATEPNLPSSKTATEPNTDIDNK